MKRCVFVSALMLCMASTVCAQKNASGVQDASPTPSPHTVSSQVYVAGKCSFTVQLNGGGLSVDDQSSIKGAVYSAPGTEEWSFSVKCYTGASHSDVYDQIGAKPVGGQWIDLDFNEPFKPKQKFKLIEFAGKNWKGIGTAVDQIYYADADRRSRFFNFCLVENNGPQVLCGRTQIRGVTQPPSTSRLPKIMAVLKTIEFVDAPAQPQAPGSASSMH